MSKAGSGEYGGDGGDGSVSPCGYAPDSPEQKTHLRLRANDSTVVTMRLHKGDAEREALEINTALTTLKFDGKLSDAESKAMAANSLTTLQIHGGFSDAAGEALGAALKTNTTLTELQIHGELGVTAADALGAALKTNNALTALHFDGKLSSAARELSAEFAMQRALRQ